MEKQKLNLFRGLTTPIQRGNWGPALKEWGLSEAKKPGTQPSGWGLSRLISEEIRVLDYF